jgi:pseudouridine synthase
VTEERLNKILAAAGLTSRRGADKLIHAGRVKVDGQTVNAQGQMVDPSASRITVDGRPVPVSQALVYYMFHKPAGFVTTLSDPQGRPTIADFLVDLPARVFPVGRLDRDVSGLLILTNDGELARRLMHPSYLVPKVYRTKVQGRPDRTFTDLLSSGRLTIDGRPAAPAKAKILRSGEDVGWVELILTEGRRRQVKLMCAAAGHPVVTLKRVAYGGLPLPKELAAGRIALLSPKQVAALKRLVGLPELPGPQPTKTGSSHNPTQTTKSTSEN